MSSQHRMTEGPIAGAIVRFAVPLFLGNLFQQMYNSVDSLIVGNYLGNSALAAVSATGTLIQLMIGFFQGVFLGAGVLVARFFGARMMDHMRRAIHTTVTVALLVGLMLSVVGMLLTPVILKWMGTPDDIFDLTVSYIRVYFGGSIGLILYNACSGIMQAVGDSKHPLYFLIASSLTNICLDLLFIGVFRWGVFSAALATIIAQFLSAVLGITRLMRADEEYRVRISGLGLDFDMIRQILNFGLPSGLQNSIINFANVIVQSNINSFGTMAVAHFCRAESRREGIRPGQTRVPLRAALRSLDRGTYRRPADPLRTIAHQRLYLRTGSHPLRAGQAAHLRTVLLPARGIPRVRGHPARCRQGKGPDGRHALLLVPLPRDLYFDPHTAHALDQRRQLGLSDHLVHERGHPVYLLHESQLGPRAGSVTLSAESEPPAEPVVCFVPIKHWCMCALASACQFISSSAHGIRK